RAVSALNESIRVSNAPSQFAVPFMTTTFLDSSVNSSPEGSALWTLAAGGGGVGVGAFSAVGVSAGDLVSAGGGTGTAEGAGLGAADGLGAGELGAGELGAGEAEGAGDWARAAPVNATMESATRAARNVLIRFISGILHPPHLAAACPHPHPPGWFHFLTRKLRFRPMTDASCAPASFVLTHFLRANRCLPQIKTEGMLSLENARG